MRFGSNHVRGTSGMMGGSSTRGQGRRCLPRKCIVFQGAASLDMIRGGLEANGTLVQGTVDMDVPKFPTLEAGFMIAEMVMGERGIMIATSPPDFSAFKGGFFVFGQGRGQGRGCGVLRSSSSFFDEVLGGGQLFKVSI